MIDKNWNMGLWNMEKNKMIQWSSQSQPWRKIRNNDSRYRYNTIQHAHSSPHLAPIRYTGNWGRKHGNKGTRQKSIESSKDHEASQVPHIQPQDECCQTRKECSGGEEVKVSDGVGNVRWRNPSKYATCIHNWEHVKREFWWDIEIFGKFHDVKEGDV